MQQELSQLIHDICNEDNVIDVTPTSIIEMLEFLFTKLISNAEELNRKFLCVNASETAVKAFLYKLCCNGIIQKTSPGYMLTSWAYDMVKNACSECGTQMSFDSTDYYCSKCVKK